MSPELFAFLAAALRDDITGLDAMATQFGTLNGSPLPSCGIVTEMEESWAALSPWPEEPLASGPVCVLRTAEEYFAGALPSHVPPAPEIPVLVAIGLLASDASEGKLIAAQLLRCALRSIKRVFQTTRGIKYPPAGVVQVTIEPPAREVYPLFLPPAATTVLIAAAILTFPVTDPWSLGAKAPAAP